MDMGLQDRVVLVTGSSMGIGRATAIAYGREGARVAITYRHQREQAEETARRVIAAGGQAIVIPYNLASEESITETVQAVLKQWGSIHVLVNNAVQWGALDDQRKLFEDVPVSTWKNMLDLSLAGVYLTIQKVVPSLRAQGWGRIVNISSDVTDKGFPGAGPYAAAKAGLHGLTRILATELGPIGVLSNVVLPGFTVTERNLETFPQQVRDMVAGQTPTGRLSTPDDVASLIVFLGSAANGHVNGELVRCTGGY